MDFPEPADTVTVDIADTATGGEAHADSVEDPGIWVLPTPMSLPSAPAGQVSGEQAQQEPGAPQELVFPNDGMGPRPGGDDITGQTAPSSQMTVGQNSPGTTSASVTVKGGCLGVTRAENRDGSGRHR